MAQTPSIVVITAGLGVPSSTTLLGERIAAAIADQRPDVTVTRVSLRDHAVDLMQYMLSRVPTPGLRGVLDAVGSADGLVAVTPVFNGSYSGVFKLFFDALDEQTLAGRPVLLAATGGTPRHSLVIDQIMLPLFHYLRAIVVPTGVFAATADWGTAETGLQRRIAAATSELLDLVDRFPRPEPGGDDDVIDFSTLLGR